MNYCPNCGTKLQEGAKYCINCGAPIEAVPQPIKAEKEHPTGLVLSIIAITLAVVMFFLASCGLFAINLFFSPPTLVLGVLGCVFAGRALKKDKFPEAKTSLTLSIIALSVTVLTWTLVLIWCFTLRC